MGLFGGGNSKRSTTNNDNRIVNDFANAVWDNSVDNDFDKSINGEYAGNTGNIDITDGGAIDSMYELSSEGFSFANDAISLNSELVSQYGDLSSGMLDASLSSSTMALNNAAEIIDTQGARNIDAVMAISEQGYQQMALGSNLALSLFGTSQEAAILQQQDNNNALENGFKSSMQFVEDFSRSDGADVAKTNMKTIGIIAVGAVLAIFAFKQG